LLTHSIDSKTVSKGLTRAGLTEHVLNARRKVSPRAGIIISKAYPDSPDKIDWAVAATLAWAARLDSMAKITERANGEHGKSRILVLD